MSMPWWSMSAIRPPPRSVPILRASAISTATGRSPLPGSEATLRDICNAMYGASRPNAGCAAFSIAGSMACSSMQISFIAFLLVSRCDATGCGRLSFDSAPTSAIW